MTRWLSFTIFAQCRDAINRVSTIFARQRIVAIGLLFCLWLPVVYADTTSLDEYKIKVGYLFNFTKFIDWSEMNSPTFNICLFGNDPFGDLIDPIEQRTAFNRPIKLFRLNAPNKDIHCHIIYVGNGFSVKSLGSKSNTLTVGEDSKFIEQGGMVAFVSQDDKIKLQINLKLAQQNSLKISAKLLEVSTVVE